MKIRVFDDKLALGRAAAFQAGALIHSAQAARGTARILVATGGSQFEFLEALTASKDFDWSRVELFHLDEYVGLPIDHPASFRRYLLERVIRKTGVSVYHLLDGEADPAQVCREMGARISTAPVDVAFVGIGENGHIAFNDPPADFKIETPYFVVALDEACRRQQVGEGWFASLAEVPMWAISISVRQLMKARAIVSVVPDARKAEAVRRCLEGPVSPAAPASILRRHPHATLYLDRDSAAGLDPQTVDSGAPAS